jgi:RES domain-containing protein
MGMIPVDLSIVTIEIPKNTGTEAIGFSKLPSHWRVYPAPIEIADLGSRWVVENRSLILRVPSAVVPGDFNILINPSHPEIREVKIKSVEPYELDKRLLPDK